MRAREMVLPRFIRLRIEREINGTLHDGRTRILARDAQALLAAYDCQAEALRNTAVDAALGQFLRQKLAELEAKNDRAG